MLEAAAVDELQSTAGEKEAALRDWIEEKQADIQALANAQVTVEQTAALKGASLQLLPTGGIRDRIVKELEARVSAGEFLSVMLLDPRLGKILASTNPLEVGRLKNDRAYFLKGKEGTYITPVYFSPDLQAPAITTSAPILSADGQLLGVLAGRLDLAELNAIIQRRSGIHQTDDAFLVNTTHQPVTQPRFLPDPAVLQEGIYTVPVNRCLEGQSGSAFADDYRGVPVIAVYRWLPERQICLIVKISQAEALAQEHSFAITSALLWLAALLIASLVATGLSHTLIAPIRAMQTAAQRYGRGDLAVRLSETRYDELGSLAREFNAMASSLAEQENKLRQHSLELEQRVAEGTAELEHSQKRFQALIENAPDGIALFGLDGKLRQMTPSTLQILGYTLEDAQEQDPALLTHPDDLPGLLNVVNNLFENPDQVVRIEYRFQHKDGSWRWLESTISNLIAEPSIEAIVFNYRDITERKQAEEAVRESEEKFKYIFDHSLVGKSITRVDGTLTVNKAFCDMLGYSQEELVNQRWQDITHPEDIEGSNRVVQLLLAGEKDSVRFTKRYLHKNGSTIWADVSISLRRDQEGKPLYFMTALMDITERKQTEMQLADTLEFNEHILTSAPIGIFTYKLSGECLSANAAAAQMVGATVDQLKNQNFRELESWKQSGLYDLAEQAIASRQLVAADVHVITTFGKNAWYRAQFVTFKSGGDDILLMIFNDITERKQAEAALAASERRFRTWIEHASDIVTVTDASGFIQYESPSIKRLLGYEPEELLGKNPFEFVHPEDQERVVAAFVENMQDPNASISAEYRFQHKDGSWRFLEAIGHVFVDEYDEVVGLIHSRDITDRKLVEQSLQEKERLLSETQHIGHIGSFSYDITENALQFSDEMYHLFDILPEKFQHNRDVLAWIYPSDRPLADKWLEDVRAGRQIRDVDFRIFRQNGELRYLRCKGAIEFNSGSKPVRFIGTVQDVTDRRLAEIQIDQQIKHLTALSEIDRAIISGSDQHHTLGVILSQTLSQLQVDAAGILLLDADGQTLSYAAEQGFQAQVGQIQVRIGESHAGRVARERRLIRIPSLPEQTNDPLFNTLVVKEKFVSYVGVPLIVKREVKGVLEVFHRTSFQPYQEWLDFLNTLAGQTAIALENTSLLGNLKTSNQELEQAYDATLEGWSHAMDLRDKETEGHTRRVTELTLKVARAMGMNESQLTHIRRGALLHDIGKLGIPDQILFKPGKLTPEEWETMQKHPEYAYEMLSSIQYLKPALPIPYFHHEKWDGSGYPLGLRGEQIPLEARIFSVIDVWDALLSDRPYRKAWTVERTLEHIRALAGSHFDPVVVDCFMRIMKP